MQVKLKGISKRGKDRINSHGEIFELIEDGDIEVIDRSKVPERRWSGRKILVQSLNNTWCGQKWLGWLEIDKEVKIID